MAVRRIKATDISGMFNEADYFNLASGALIYHYKDSKEADKKGIEKVAWVNHAFSIELYLKCLSVIEKGDFITGHNLLTLYNDLGTAIKEQVASAFKNSSVNYPHGLIVTVTENKGDIVEFLKEIEEPFVYFRYLFEKPDFKEKYRLGWLSTCLRAAILNNKKDLEEERLVF